MNSQQKHDLIEFLLSPSSVVATSETVQTETQWQHQFATLSTHWNHPADCAIAGGFCSGSVGMAFSFGYQNALRALAPAQVQQQRASFCVTEKGGNSPASIQTTLTPHPDGHWILNGQKSFVTGAEQSQLLLVAATTGLDSAQRNRLALVAVETNQAGIAIERLPDLPFAPDVSHGRASFTNVEVSADQLLPGDGYADYVKPFRTIEDIHVSAALLGYLLQIARRHDWPETAQESLVALIVMHRALAAMSPRSGTTHIALAGARHQLETWLRQHQDEWSRVPAAIADAWRRDAVLLDVAAKAGTQRTLAAWKRLRESGS